MARHARATPTAQPSLATLHSIHDCIVLALDIADNRCPFPEEACDLLREALAEMRALLEEMGHERPQRRTATS